MFDILNYYEIPISIPDVLSNLTRMFTSNRYGYSL